MACSAALDAFRVATEDIDQEVFRQASYRSLWLDMVPREMYQLGKGVLHSVFALGDIEPAALESWAAITLANGSTDACANNWNDVEWGYDESTYAPEQFQLRGPVVCDKDLLFSHDVDTFLSGYMSKLAIRARRTWELRYEAIHVSLARKAIADPDFTGTFKSQSALTSLAQSDCELSQEMLEVVASYLNEDGAPNPDGMGYIEWAESGPLYTLLIGQDQSQRILRQNAELREDYRFGDADTLLKRLGASRVIGNFRHVINQRPRRYTFSGGTYTYVPPYITAVGGEDATKGTKQIINPSWRTAPYEAADVLAPNLFTSQVVPAKNRFDGVQFPAKSYMGEWQFVTGPDAHGTNTCDDPLHHTGRHFAEFMHAPKPNPIAKWKHAYHVIFKRCLHSSVECTTCSS